ncbi:MAG TPA: hypothetical protein DCG57_16925 [Candidatus Riflebacteria bacterium]|jgi:hypothetical protein|nr:hypothetical protein [Candidatus Riflebacteria bacterium]
MSAVCLCCGEDIRPPEEFWCGYTVFSPDENYLCGNCLKNIPDEHRIRFDEPPMFQILFARRKAEIDDSGNYQNSGSTAEPPEFWVDANIIACYLPSGTFFLQELFPYYCIAELPKLIHPLFAVPTPDNRAKGMSLLCLFGAPLEAFVFKRKISELERPMFFKGDILNLAEEEEDQAKELLGHMLVKFAHVFYELEPDWLAEISAEVASRAKFAVDLACSFLDTHIYMYTSKHCSDCRKNRFRASTLSRMLRDILAKERKITSVEQMSKEIDSRARDEAEEYRARNGLD